jgi:hypothetical protein
MTPNEAAPGKRLYDQFQQLPPDERRHFCMLLFGEDVADPKAHVASLRKQLSAYRRKPQFEAADARIAELKREGKNWDQISVKLFREGTGPGWRGPDGPLAAATLRKRYSRARNRQKRRSG